MPVAPRPELAGVRPAAHGGLDYAELAALGLAPATILDFSVNINSAPLPAELQDQLSRVEVSTYPDSIAGSLREVAARRYGVTPDMVLAGNGSSELIWLACLAYVRPGDTVAVRQPTFGEYARAARIYGAAIRRFDAPLPQPTTERLAFICNPNNPTGDVMPVARILNLAREHPDTLLVVDEAYAEFVGERPTAIGPSMPPNVLVLRSLTKFAGLAGLRLGLAFAQPEVIAALAAVKPPWNVNALAQAAGEYALCHSEFLPDLKALARQRAYLEEGLRRVGLEPEPSSCNFLLAGVPGNAKTIRDQLLAKGILVRDCASFGLPNHIRLSVRPEPDCDRLLRCMADVGLSR
ncbi:MAG: histidinol-phosphate aminotransferase family protein [Chloroflexi bacterium]|nr:histidinol-phosphate aminotransferase family protein [Chloroflexota bacterium]